MSLYEDFEPQPEHYNIKEKKMSFKIKSIERKPMTSKAGKPYTQLIVLTEDGRRASGFGNKSNDSWTIGYTVEDTEAVIVQNGKYYNIEMVEKKTINTTKAETATAVQLLQGIAESLNTINKKLDRLLNEGTNEKDDLPEWDNGEFYKR